MAYIRSEMKADAKKQLGGNWGAFIGALLVLVLVSGVVSVVFYPDPQDVLAWEAEYYISLSVLALLGSVIQLLVFSPLNLGWYGMTLDATYNRQIAFASLFNGFKRIWDAVLLAFFYGLFIFLWSLLLIIPGIIKTYSYAMSYYILADNPQMKPLEAITKSRQMMDGHKVELFVLQLSFIPWMLLVGVTFGLASLYVAPYVNVTMANFYRRLKAENEVTAFSGGYQAPTANNPISTPSQDNQMQPVSQVPSSETAAPAEPEPAVVDEPALDSNSAPTPEPFQGEEEK